MSVDINQIQTGDRFFVIGLRNNHKKIDFISRSIMFWMKLLGKQLGINNVWVGSHAATLIWLNDILYVCESIDKGFVVHEMSVSYDLDTEDYIIVRNINGYTEDQKKTIVRSALQLSAVSITYNFLIVIQWTLYILSGFISKKHRLNLFFKKTRRINYCYQSTKIIAHNADPEVFDDNYRNTSWFDIFVPEKQVTVIDHRLNNVS